MHDRDAIPSAAEVSPKSCGAAVWRHAQGSPSVLVGMAAHLGGGLYAAVADKGVQGPWGGKWRDLRIHLLDGSGAVLWADWADTIPNAVVVLKVRASRSLPADPAPAPMHEVAASAHAAVFRIGYGNGVFADVDASRPPRAAAGCVLSQPVATWYRNGADPAGKSSAVCAHANFDYPGDRDLGSPVVTEDGRLAGVLIGGNLGPEASHQGAYVPVDLVLPHARMLEALHARFGGGWRGPSPVVHHADFEAVVQAVEAAGPADAGWIPVRTAAGEAKAWEGVGRPEVGDKVVRIPEGASVSWNLLRRIGLFDAAGGRGLMGGLHGDVAEADLAVPLAPAGILSDTLVGTDVAAFV